MTTMRNVRDIVRDLRNDNTVKEKVPYVAPTPPPPPAREVDVRGREERPPARKITQQTAIPAEPQMAPRLVRRDPAGLKFVDHTVEIDGEIGAGYLVRNSSNVDLGYVWCIQSCWKWCTMDKKNFGERKDRKAAAQVLQDIHSTRA